MSVCHNKQELVVMKLQIRDVQLSSLFPMDQIQAQTCTRRFPIIYGSDTYFQYLLEWQQFAFTTAAGERRNFTSTQLK